MISEYKKIGNKIVNGKNKNIYVKKGSKSRIHYVKHKNNFVKLADYKLNMKGGAANSCYLYSRTFNAYLGVNQRDGWDDIFWQPIELKDKNNTGTVWTMLRDSKPGYFFKNESDGSYLGYKYINDTHMSMRTYNKMKENSNIELGTSLTNLSHIHLGTYSIKRDIIRNKNNTMITNNTILNKLILDDMIDYNIEIKYVDRERFMSRIKGSITKYLSTRESGVKTRKSTR